MDKFWMLAPGPIIFNSGKFGQLIVWRHLIGLARSLGNPGSAVGFFLILQAFKLNTTALYLGEKS